MTRAICAASLCALILTSVNVVLAATTEEASLNACQNAVKVATARFVSKKIAAIGTCLQAISTQLVKNNAVDAGAAARTCVAQFRTLSDSRALGKSLPEKLAAGIAAKCTPGGTNPHTIGDIVGPGAGVSQPLRAGDLSAWCRHFGGDGSIDTLQEWMDCINAAAECDVDSAIAAQYPRVLDWLALVEPSMQALTPPGTDPTKITDAVAGLDVVKAEIDGPDNDNVVSLQCGGIVSTGTAAASDVLAAKTFSNSTAGSLTGTMPNNGAVTLTPSTADQTIAAGYHNGSGKCVGDADLASANIRSGVNLFGINGDATVVNTSSGTAAAGDLLSGKIGWVAGAQVTGSMPNNGVVVLMPGASNQTIATGYHNGSGYCAGDANLVAGNIKNGATIFGVSGNPNVVNTTGATAMAGNIAGGQTCYANGSLVTGSATAGSNVNGGNGLKTFTIPDGLYSGSKTATADDANLVGGNIVSGTSIFGVAGTQPPSLPLKTGQTTASGTDSDGNLQKGEARGFADNGDGTITDNHTGLMWEKKDQAAGGVHNFNNTYGWCLDVSPADGICDTAGNPMDGTIITTFLAMLNAGGGFAGHTDWRIPNQNELKTLVNYQNLTPATDAAFDTNCVANCTVLTCSCTQSDAYWSSTTYQNNTNGAWGVSFYDGEDGALSKWYINYARAVRGGL